MKAPNKQQILKWRLFLVFFGISLLAIGVLVKIAHIQIVEGKKWIALSDSILIKPFKVKAERGNLITENGTFMATSVPIYNIALDLSTELMQDSLLFYVDTIANHLSNILLIENADDLKQKLKSGLKKHDQYLMVAKKISYTQLQKIKQLPIIKAGKYKGGLIVEQMEKRIMPFGSLALRTIGYTRDSTEFEGAKSIGLEAYYDKYLKGTEGLIFKKRISATTWKDINDDREIEPHNGMDIITTLDVNLQAFADSALRRKVMDKQAERASLILMETKTGKIRAMVNLTKKDSSQYIEDINYAIRQSEEPGSTFKLASFLAMFDDGLIDTTQSIGVSYSHGFYNRTMYDSHKPHKSVFTVSEVFEQSSNVGTAKFIYNNYSNNPSAFISKLRQFHLLDKTNIDLQGESTPIAITPNSKHWSGVSLPWLSIGYGITLAPIQTLTFYNAVANNGKMMKPYLVSEIQQDGVSFQKFEPQVVDEQIASPSAIAKAKHLLENVVTKGTADKIKTDAYSIAGKTGTAQMAVNGSYDNGLYQASFCGYFPADDPVYTCMVMVITKDAKEIYGGQLGAPVFRELADKAIAHYIKERKELDFYNDTIPYNISQITSSKSIKAICSVFNIQPKNHVVSEWAYCQGQSNLINNAEYYIDKNTVPDVIGMSLKDALYMLESKGLKVVFTGIGKVQIQSVLPGTNISKGQTIQLQLS